MKKHRLRKPRRTAQAGRIGKRLGRVVETLENRSLLAGDTFVWHNFVLAEDVDYDNHVTPHDILLVIDALNRSGINSLNAAASLADVRGSDDPFDFREGRFLDVSGDGLLSPVDALLVIDTVNRAALGEIDTMDIRTIVTDVAGNPITEIVAGTNFLIALEAEDTRAVQAGVFSVYADVFFDPTLATFDPGPLAAAPSLSFNPEFSRVRSGTLEGAVGSIDEAGAFNNSLSTPSTTGAVVVWTTSFQATSAGTLLFDTDPADVLPAHESLVYERTNVFSNPLLTHVDGMVTAVAEAAPVLSVGNVTVQEGASGTTFADFTVTLNTTSSRDVAVLYSTVDGTATDGSDYTGQISGTLVIPAGQMTGTISVEVFGDMDPEGNEGFTVHLLLASNATIGDGVGVGAILENTDANLAIDGFAAEEGDFGTTDFTFTVTRFNADLATATVVYSTVDGTATVTGSDYQPTSGTLTFLPGETMMPIVVRVEGDLTDEFNETFSVQLSSAVNATISNPTAIGSIVNDDTAPSVMIAAASGTEGSNLSFAVTLSAASGKTISVPFIATFSGGPDAASAADFTPTSGALTFAPGETSKEILVAALPDLISAEPLEMFLVNLGMPSNAILGSSSASGTIVNVPIPTIAITDRSIVEGNAGTQDMVFTVSLSNASPLEVLVSFATQDNTAVAGPGGDYLAQVGVLTFAPGETSKPIMVPIRGDLLDEGDEFFFVNLSSVSGAALPDSQAIGTIIDDDRQGFSISNAQVVEGNAGTRQMIFTVQLNAPVSQQTTVAFATSDGSAMQPGDYAPTAGVLTFAANQTSQTITVLINGDTDVEPNENFTVTLSGAVGARIVDGTATGTIFDDDGTLTPQVVFRIEARDTSDLPVSQLNVGDNFTLLVYVQDVSSVPTGVYAAYLDLLYESAIVQVEGVPVFSAIYPNGRTANTGTLGVIDEAGAFDTDAARGPDEQLLFTVPMRTIGSGQALFEGEAADQSPSHDVLRYDTNGVPVPPNQIDYGVFTLDVGSNAFQIGDATVVEGNFGTTNLVFSVTRFRPDATTATVVFDTSDGTATLADNDYQATSGVLTFAPGDTTPQTISVKVNGDLKIEADETMRVTLTGAVNATIGTPIGIGTIQNDEALPTVSIGNASGGEGTNLNFTVTLSVASDQQIMVPFNTAADVGPNSATPGVDFTSTSGVLTFAPGQTSMNLSVAARTDFVDPEPNETFLVRLGDPINAVINDGTGVGTITNTPPAGISGFVYIDADNDGRKDANEAPLGGVIVTIASDDGTLMQTDITDANGFYSFIRLPPDTYFVTEFQPGFYIDGLENPPPLATGVAIVGNDQYSTDLVANPTITNLNFGERGILPQFLGVVLNRRAYLSTTLDNGVNGPNASLVNADLTKGDIWVSFDAGWDGLRKFQSFFSQGNITLKLYDLDFRRDLRLLATSQIINGRPEIAWVDGLETPRTPLFLQISGTSHDASMKIIDTLRVVEQAVVEGNAGVTDRTFEVRLSAGQTGQVTVQYATANGTATNPADYRATSGTLTFAVGETTKQITVPIVGDLLDENNETFVVTLTNASTFVEVAPGPFEITITDEDPSPKLNIGDAAIAEGNAGTTNALFTVTMSAMSGRQVTVAYATAGGNATANSDYTTVSGTLTFAPGVLAQTISVPISGDTFVEGNETFNVLLSSAANASILDGVALGTITNDDAGPAFFTLTAPANQTGSGLLSYTESSAGRSSTATSTTNAQAPGSAPTSGYSRPIASRGRKSTSAVDAALAEEDDWTLVA